MVWQPEPNWETGKYLLHCSKRMHFFGAEVFKDGSAALFLSHRRHVRWTLTRVELAWIARGWKTFQVLQGQESTSFVAEDVRGGAVASRDLTSVLHIVEANVPVPCMELAELRGCSKALLALVGDVEARFSRLRREALRALRHALNGSLLPPRFRRRAIPRATWDVAFCQQFADMHFPLAPFYGSGCAGGRALSAAWRRRNPSEAAVLSWMQNHIVRERHYSSLQLHRETAGLWIVRSARVVQLLLGPARLFLSFEEVAETTEIGDRGF